MYQIIYGCCKMRKTGERLSLGHEDYAFQLVSKIALLGNARAPFNLGCPRLPGDWSL
jgi:hypothetical protein